MTSAQTVNAYQDRLALLAALRDPSLTRSWDLPTWHRVIQAARAANLMSRLAIALDDAGLLPALPAPVRPHCVAALRLCAHQIEAVRRECRHIARAMEAVGAPVVLLKGAAYAMGGLQAARGRLFGDIDVLVARDSLPRAEAALMQWGWTTGAIDPYDDRYYRQWMHEIPPMMHRARGTLIDVHHNILPSTSRHVPDPSIIFAASTPTEFAPLSLPSREHMVIHSAVHLFHEGEANNALRDLIDLSCLMTESADPDFWSALIRDSAALGLVWPVFLAVRYAKRFLQTDIPDAVLADLHRRSGFGSWRLRWLDTLYLAAFLGHRSSASTPQAMLLGTALYVRAHALRMPLFQLGAHLSRKAFLRLFKHSSRSG